jgi:hypothetical protein
MDFSKLFGGGSGGGGSQEYGRSSAATTIGGVNRGSDNDWIPVAVVGVVMTVVFVFLIKFAFGKNN